jgi:hypothetical protein
MTYKVETAPRLALEAKRYTHRADIEVHRTRRGYLSRSKTGMAGDLLVFRASGGARVFVDQSAQDRFSADLLCVHAGHGGARSVRFAVGDALGDALVRPGREILVNDFTW